MAGSIPLSAAERKELHEIRKHDPKHEMRLRAHILLLLDAGRTWEDIQAVLFCSSATIARWKKRYERPGLDAVFKERRGRPRRLSVRWITIVVGWVLHRSPRDFGFLRSRWCCALVALLLHERYDLRVSRETIRRWLHREQLVWCRPRPVLKLEDPERAEKLGKLRQLLLHLPNNEVVVFQDEVDLSTNPDVGFMWMRKGEQVELVTPGDRQKCYLAGSLNWRTGHVVPTMGYHRNTELFLWHLDDLRKSYRRYETIHVICDNARFHDNPEVDAYLAKHPRIKLHFLPKRAPDTNPIERVWWILREHITRNHKCQNLEELVDLTLGWLDDEAPFYIESSVYLSRRAA
jgi:putative transposase